MSRRALPVLRSTFGAQHEEVAAAALLAAKIFRAAGAECVHEAVEAARQAATAYNALGRVKEAAAARELQHTVAGESGVTVSQLAPAGAESGACGNLVDAPPSDATSGSWETDAVGRRYWAPRAYSVSYCDSD